MTSFRLVGGKTRPLSSSRAVSSVTRPPRSSGPVLTDRDLEILRWIGTHGVVTPDQVAIHFFDRSDGTVGRWAAYRRIRVLEQLELLKRDHTFWRESTVLRVTLEAARLVHLDVAPAKLVLADVRHSLAVVDLLEQLLRHSPPDTRLVTERQLRARRHTALRNGLEAGVRGRIPDALLIFPGDESVAIELDLTAKRSNVYDDILSTYLVQEYSAVWWYVAPGVVRRLRAIVHANQADDLVSVEPWGK